MQLPCRRIFNHVKRSYLNRTFAILQRARPYATHADSNSRDNNNERDAITPGETSIAVGNQRVTFKCGRVARFADGAAVCQIGHTAVLATVVSEKPSGSQSGDFVPLTVDYRQKAAAAGRLPSNRLRRELGPSDEEILSSRLIDRSLRPLFDKELVFGETQLVCNPLALDGANDARVAAINAASAALSVSDLPWRGPIGAVRLGLVGDGVVINPSRIAMKSSRLDLVLAANKSGHVVMLEAESDGVTVNDLMGAIKVGVKEIGLVILAIQQLAKKHGKTKKREMSRRKRDQILLERVSAMTTSRFDAILCDSSLDKIARDLAYQRVRKYVVDELTKSEDVDAPTSEIGEVVNDVWRRRFRERVLKTGLRCDGRRVGDLRPIFMDTNLHEPLHGSALFQRGQTQVFCTLSFGSLTLKDSSDPVAAAAGFDAIKDKNFMLHYTFPSYATNEIGKPGRNRRELGHGALAEKGLRAVVPPDYPLSVRLAAEVLESNGSSSMASVCAGSLALVDAGVPVSELAAGVAIGLVTETDDDGDITASTVLTDILGIEDYLGDMDLKVAGTVSGLTAIQLDLKLSVGLPLPLLHRALGDASKAKKTILGMRKRHMNENRHRPKTNLPKSELIDVAPGKRSALLGPGGFRLKKVEAETGARLTQIDELRWQLFAPNPAAFEEAMAIVEELLRDQSDVIQSLEFGAIYPVKIVELRETGAMVEIQPGLDPVFVPSSQLDTRKVQHPSMLDLRVGQEIFVKNFGRDPVTGKLRLSRKVLQATTVTTRLTQ